VTVTVAHVFVVAAALAGGGGFLLGYRRSAAAALTGVPLLLGGAGLAMVGVSRFAAARSDALSGQEFAVAAAVVAAAFVSLAAGYLAPESENRR
jgi:NADH:ubiquinone oxidoreductase subunit K